MNKKNLLFTSFYIAIGICAYLGFGFLLFQLNLPTLQALWLLPTTIMGLTCSVIICIPIMILVALIHPLTWIVLVTLYLAKKYIFV